MMCIDISNTKVIEILNCDITGIALQNNETNESKGKQVKRPFDIS